ncbi:MAG: hypothetical protein ACK58X_02370, partial [Planctomycetota bacterium]
MVFGADEDVDAPGLHAVVAVAAARHGRRGGIRRGPTCARPFAVARAAHDAGRGEHAQARAATAARRRRGILSTRLARTFPTGDAHQG